ncbi:MAG: hypothetical protein A2X48_03455 [Lentisphaerae bacterium GWF2_49_21]|nr:MAG: hypothetical protein A2X48_03455 [Lentisphaerae bacterium GWF2_49_21]
MSYMKYDDESCRDGGNNSHPIFQNAEACIGNFIITSLIPVTVQAVLRPPPMKFTRIMMIATTSRTWTNPLIVYDVINPNSQSTIRIIAIVYNMVVLLFYLF